MPNTPAYLRIAAELRARILSGELEPGAKLPSETTLMAEYGVGRTVAKWAISVLKGEGLVEGRAGSGVYVREVHRLVRHAYGRDVRTGSGPTSPFARDAATAGQHATWEHESAHADADERIATRLGIEPGDPVMRTDYRFLANGEPIQLSTSWEPLAITGDTSVEWPEAGAAVGVVARMDAIGIHVDEFTERVTARPAHDDEIARLALSPRGAHVLVIERTYHAAGRAVETADIVFPGDRYELVYRVPVD
ncbi:GntR family transcriptional regulator [Micromonospora pattaloongensis]|uniref:GntR family transcriptional regulator n=1 Tax=Micromonospora pattaloongensis TaxID=405436 RepID=A0A1H3PTD9_9ACTN|nr:GntR family transcriptional regulator [Micromonospora pattaloongensis]SDZ04387.1 GntR family transcriptional regulator [Micromonospora pattaloongensis]